MMSKVLKFLLRPRPEFIFLTDIDSDVLIYANDVMHLIRTTVSSDAGSDHFGDVPTVQRLHHYQVYRGLSPGSASRLEVRTGHFLPPRTAIMSIGPHPYSVPL